jgi:hypothetical protein
VTYLICLDALHAAYRDLEQARIECREAAHALATIPEMRIPMKPDAYSKVKPDTYSKFVPDSVPI